MCQYCIEGGILIPMLESVYMGEIPKIEGLDKQGSVFFQRETRSKRSLEEKI